MKRSRFAEEQIIAILREHEGRQRARQERDVGSDVLQVQGEVWRHGCLGRRRLNALEE